MIPFIKLVTCFFEFLNHFSKLMRAKREVIWNLQTSWLVGQKHRYCLGLATGIWNGGWREGNLVEGSLGGESGAVSGQSTSELSWFLRHPASVWELLGGVCGKTPHSTATYTGIGSGNPKGVVMLCIKQNNITYIIKHIRLSSLIQSKLIITVDYNVMKLIEMRTVHVYRLCE